MLGKIYYRIRGKYEGGMKLDISIKNVIGIPIAIIIVIILIGIAGNLFIKRKK